MQTDTVEYDYDLLVKFELGIDPLSPEHSKIPAHVLGYGEMSTVLTISQGNPNLVYKRMPMFYREEELEPYLALYKSYLKHLTAAGIKVVPAAVTSIMPQTGNIVVYIIQEKLDSNALANKAIQPLPAVEAERLFRTILEYTGRVFAYNKAHAGEIELGFDAQMSNWAVAQYDPNKEWLPDNIELVYIDTSSPLLRRHGEEQLDPELFLRSAPSFLRWLIRLLFLDDVMNRYYNHRQVIIDMVANLYKEKRDDLIPSLMATANENMEETARNGDFQSLTEDEIAGYYREDARIWKFYLTSRRVDRRLHRLLGKPYPYVLPGHIDR